MNTNEKIQPTIFVIFGGTGDLNARKLAPALYNLYLEGWLPNQFSIIGTGRTTLKDEEFRGNLLKDINQFSRSGKVSQSSGKSSPKTCFIRLLT
jgi:glucose-6-phosphate 1-dehydrogenase